MSIHLSGHQVIFFPSFHLSIHVYSSIWSSTHLLSIFSSIYPCLFIYLVINSSSFHLFMPIHLYIQCPFVHLFIYIYPSICRIYNSPSFHLFIYPSIHLPSICSSIHLFTFLPSFHLYISIYLSHL